MGSRIPLIFTVYVFTGLGVFLLAAPWSPVWEAATMAIAPTPAGEFARSGGVRGIVSGLGALNLWVAIERGALLWRSVRESGGEVERG